MTIPTIPTGWVVGSIHHATADGPDALRAAESLVAIGTVTFTPTSGHMIVDFFTAVTRTPIVAVLDAEGDIHPQRAQSDNTEDGISLPIGSYAVTYSLAADYGTLPGHTITVTEAHTTAAPLPLFASMAAPDTPGDALANNSMTDDEITTALGA